MQRWLAWISIFTFLVGGGCGGRDAPASVAAHAEAAAQPASSNFDDAEAATLVVAVIIDQLAAWVVERYREHLPEDGALRTGMRAGVYIPRARYSYANTVTAPGHAAVHTGVPAYRNGIYNNAVWNRESRQMVASVWDAEHPALHEGVPGASPRGLRVPTVADALKEATQGRARVVSLSMKDRGAVIAAGRRADLVLWYAPEARGYTTSTYFASELPGWLTAWQSAQPVTSWLRPWQPEQPELYARLLGPDAAPGEGPSDAASFPHHPDRAADPLRAFMQTPAGTEHLLALAGEAARRLELGADEIPDLLAISISGTDLIGHRFGPESWEYLDNLIRVDRALGALLRELQARAPTAVLITADHGVAPLPEQRARAGLAGGRLSEQVIAEVVRQAAAETLGSMQVLEAIVSPFVYLTDAVRRDPDYTKLTAAACAGLERLPGVAGCYEVRAAVQLRQSDDPIERAVGRSIPDDLDADLYVVFAEGWFAGGGSVGTSHGTPWDYDSEVPVIFWGPGVNPSAVVGTVPARSGEITLERVAATLAALLRVPPPEDADWPPLPGAPTTP